MAKLVTPPVDSNALPTILALAVHDDLDNESDIYSSSSLSTNSSGRPPRDLSVQDRIPLAISDWSTRASLDIPTHETHQTAIEYLTYFVNMGLKQGLLNDSHPIAILRHSLNELGAQNPQQQQIAIRRVAHNRLNPPTFTLQLREFIFNEIPIFNIWDAITLIYSISVEDVFCDREVDLFLYQLRLIFNSMKATRIWGTDHIPSTVAASWTTTGPNRRFLVAYSVTCIKGRKGKLLLDQNLARQNYNRRLYSLVQKSDQELRDLGHGDNRAGNCPEYSTWGTICTGPGVYNFLCLNIAKERTMECCGPCQDTANEARKVGISISDRWKTCSLVSSEGEENESSGGYQGKEMDSISKILSVGRGRKVRKTRRH